MSEVQSQVTALAADLQRVLARLITVMRRGDTAAGSRPDLTMAQVSILLTLIDSGPIRMTELAARERVRTPTTTVAIRRLEKLGLVKRSRDPSDLRAVLVDITPKGHAEHRESLDARHAALVTMLHALDSEDITAIRNAIGPLERLALGPAGRES